MENPVTTVKHAFQVRTILMTAAGMFAVFLILDLLGKPATWILQPWTTWKNRNA